MSGRRKHNVVIICQVRANLILRRMRFCKFYILSLASLTVLGACGTAGQDADRGFQPQPGQGQYVRPAFLDPELPSRLPEDDLCQARIYQSLVGQFEGGLYFQAIPGRQRIIKEAVLDELERDDEFLTDLNVPPPFVEVREFLSGQPVYSANIRTTPEALALEPAVEDRLTIVINIEGIVIDVSCG